ncbi:hypothetical protein TSAR_009006 [Trichomalopsis sarcophagae]|uniref:Uncharacterized protein n=1 Tax=Trichomalopsis sarcophagae TaxID=543379 RepID=A0A232EW12_9HYME|nr:hypothetical protein TSAR_009006 [Trichomalopsis sarcophagae]
MRQREFRESSKSTSTSVGGASARRHDKAAGAFEGQILEEVDEEEEEIENEPGESTPALEALRLACAEAQQQQQQQQQQQLVTESKYSSMVQFRAPDIIEL